MRFWTICLTKYILESFVLTFINYISKNAIFVLFIFLFYSSFLYVVKDLIYFYGCNSMAYFFDAWWKLNFYSNWGILQWRYEYFLGKYTYLNYLITGLNSKPLHYCNGCFSTKIKYTKTTKCFISFFVLFTSKLQSTSYTYR